MTFIKLLFLILFLFSSQLSAKNKIYVYSFINNTKNLDTNMSVFLTKTFKNELKKLKSYQLIETNLKPINTKSSKQIQKKQKRKKKHLKKTIKFDSTEITKKFYSQKIPLILIGTIKYFNLTNIQTDSDNLGKWTMYEAKIAINFKLINSVTKKIKNFNIIESITSETTGIIDIDNNLSPKNLAQTISETLKELKPATPRFNSSILARVLDKALNEFSLQLKKYYTYDISFSPAYIIDIDNKFFYVNLGSKDKLKKGNTLIVTKPFGEQKKIAELKVVSILAPKLCKSIIKKKITKQKILIKDNVKILK